MLHHYNYDTKFEFNYYLNIVILGQLLIWMVIQSKFTLKNIIRAL